MRMTENRPPPAGRHTRTTRPDTVHQPILIRENDLREAICRRIIKFQRCSHDGVLHHSRTMGVVEYCKGMLK
jgi:hypothetical protein